MLAMNVVMTCLSQTLGPNGDKGRVTVPNDDNKGSFSIRDTTNHFYVLIKFTKELIGIMKKKTNRNLSQTRTHLCICVLVCVL